MKENPDFHFTFEYKNANYQAEVWHYSQLSIRERMDHHITENCYLVYVEGFKPFEMFVGEDLEWHTQSSFVVDEEIVQIIGLQIHNKSM